MDLVPRSHRRHCTYIHSERGPGDFRGHKVPVPGWARVDGIRIRDGLSPPRESTRSRTPTRERRVGRTAEMSRGHVVSLSAVQGRGAVVVDGGCDEMWPTPRLDRFSGSDTETSTRQPRRRVDSPVQSRLSRPVGRHLCTLPLRVRACFGGCGRHVDGICSTGLQPPGGAGTRSCRRDDDSGMARVRSLETALVFSRLGYFALIRLLSPS